MGIKGIIVGAGRAGTHLHYGAHRAAGAEIQAFVDANPEFAEKAAARFGVRRAFGDLREALEKLGTVDFVDICTASSTHFSLAKQAVESGCHVLIEKPLTETMDELEALKSLRADSGRLICAVHNHRYYPSMVMLREMVASGALGKIRSIHKEFMFNRETVRMMEPEHWAHGIPGGRLFEANPHNLYLIHSLVGSLELDRLTARKSTSRWAHANIDEFTATLTNSEICGSIRMSMHADGRAYGKHGPNFFIVVGEKKSVYADYNGIRELAPRAGRFSVDWKGLREKVRRRLGDRPPEILDRSGGKINLGLGSGHYWMIDRFDGFLSGKYNSEPVPFEEAYYTQKMNLLMGARAETISQSGQTPEHSLQAADGN